LHSRSCTVVGTTCLKQLLSPPHALARQQQQQQQGLV
jgi:hypothetical protein